MAASAVEICNEALSLVGAAPITSLTDQSAEGRLSNSFYASTRDELLVSHPWKFATKRALLAADPTPPAFDYGSRFLLPTDCLRVLGTNLGTETQWTMENGYLLTYSSSQCGIKYISRIVTEATFSINFCEALAYKLASKMAFPLSQNASLAASLFQTHIIYLKDAKSMDAQSSQGAVVESNDWLWSRY